MTAFPANFWFTAAMDTLCPVDPPAAQTAANRVELHDIRQALAGDGEAYRRLLERYQTEIAKRLRKFTRDPRILEELVQETFVDAYFSLKNFRGDAPLLHWLHRIAVRVGYRHWKAKKAARITTSLESQDIAAAKSSEPDTELLHKVLDQLSPRDRLVVTLMYLEERSVEETAELTGWTKTMVKVQSFRARGKLRKLMENTDKKN